MNTRGKMAIGILVLAFLIWIVPEFSIAQVQVKVKCDKGQSVQGALDALTGPATLVVTGTCHEYLDITKDDVTIQGGIYQPPSTPDPSKNIIWVRGARRVLITGVTVEGGYNGISAYLGASLTLENSTVSGAANNGVVSVFGSAVTVNSSTMQGNLSGAAAADNSAIVVTNSYIQDNTGTGVVVVRSSSARIGQNLRGQQMKNWITNNGTGPNKGSGVYIGRSSYAIIDGNTIDNNTSTGIAIEGATATIINNSIRSNGMNGIDIYGEGHARIGITDGTAYAKNYIENNGRDGVKISEASNAFLLANDIKNNVRNGIGIYRADCGLIGDNIIQGNQGNGMSISQGRLFQGKGDWSFTPGEDLITQNTYSGINAWNNASADIRKVRVTNNGHDGIYVGVQSSIRIYDSTVSGHPSPYNGIFVHRGSTIILDHPSDVSPVIVTGNTGWGVLCGDAESSLAGDTTGVTGNGTPSDSQNVNCTGF